MLFASRAPVNVVAPVTPRVPPTLASAVTLKPVPLPLLKVNVSAISAVLFASRAPVNVVTPVTSRVLLNVVAPATFNVELISVAPALKSCKTVVPVTSKLPKVGPLVPLEVTTLLPLINTSVALISMLELLHKSITASSFAVDNLKKSRVLPALNWLPWKR